jgi:riboflavin kinase/FMN adenylyltransferase
MATPMMQIIEWRQFLEESFPLSGKLSSMTVGIFDGVHRGHQALLKQIVTHDENKIPVVVTFRQNHKTEHDNILTFSQRLEIFESFGIQVTVVIDFTEEFRQMPGIEFLKILLKHGNVGFFAVGNDFRCGYQQDTDAVMIQNFFTSHNIPAEIVPKVMEGSLPVSSSRIRSAINAGDVELAQKMLGRTYP